MAGKKNEQVEITPPATLEEALKLIEAKDAEIKAKAAEVEAKDAEIKKAIAAIQSKNAEIEAKDAEIEAKATEITGLKADKVSLQLDLENAAEAFKTYKEEAEAALDSLGKDSVIVTDRPVLRYNGTLYKFKLTKFAVRGKGMVTAQQIIDNPDGYDIDELINKFQILKPYKV